MYTRKEKEREEARRSALHLITPRQREAAKVKPNQRLLLLGGCTSTRGEFRGDTDAGENMSVRVTCQGREEDEGGMKRKWTNARCRFSAQDSTSCVV